MQKKPGHIFLNEEALERLEGRSEVRGTKTLPTLHLNVGDKNERG